MKPHVHGSTAAGHVLPERSDDSDPSPRLISDHHLVRRIGRGSYGEVWLARNVTGQYRAVKIVHRNRFEEARPYEREFEGIRRFEPISRDHSGFISILHIGRNDAAGYFYCIMELADDMQCGPTIDPQRYTAKTLARELGHRGRIPIAECLHLGEGLSASLEFLHQHGLIHRDIKPSNIVFVGGRPKFADIGLVAEKGENDSIVGTEGYIPPEGPGTAGADVYSLGKVFYQMSTGRSVAEFPEWPTEVAEGPERAAFAQFNQIILKACERNVADRFAVAGELREALLRLGREGGCVATAPLVETAAGLTSGLTSGPRRLEGERKLVTVLALSVIFADDLDPEESHARCAHCFELIRTEIQRFEGTVAQRLNDGVLALFGAPVAHEDHPQRAVHAALAIHRVLAGHAAELGRLHNLHLQVRSGLSSGLLVIGGTPGRPMAAGEAANLASRLVAVAAPGQILVAESLAATVTGYFETRSAGAHRLPGVTEQVQATEVLGAREARTRIEVMMRSGLSPFVGRDRELNLLRERFADARNGRGQIVLCVGEPGVGKSRTLLELRRSLEGQELTWLHGRALSYGRQTAYLPVAELLRQYFCIPDSEEPEAIRTRIDASLRTLGADLEPVTGIIHSLLSVDGKNDTLRKLDVQQRKTHAFEALRALLFAEARLRPTVVVVEDLHWIDKISEEFLGVLAESMARSRILLLVNYRPGYKGPFPDGTFVTRLALDRLSDGDSEKLARGMVANRRLSGEARELIAAKAEGNPFFVEELVKSLLESGTLRSEGDRCVIARPQGAVHVPNTVQDVLMSRIDRLEAAPRKVLQLASVIGREFSVGLVQAIADLREPLQASLQYLQSLELIYQISSAGEPSYVFKHALTQDVAYQSLLIQRRQELHRLVAASIEELYQSRLPEYYSLLGYHYERGEEWERALDYLARAAERSRGVAAFREEADLLTQVMAIAQRLNRTDLLPELHGRRGTAWHNVGVWVEARADLEIALEELPLDRAELRAELLAELAGCCFWGLDIPSSQRHVALGLPLAKKVARNDLVAGLMGWEAAGQQSDGNLLAAIELYEQALDIGGGYHSPSLGNYPLLLYLLGRIPEAVQGGRRSEEMYERLANPLAITFGRPHLGLALAASGQYDEALRVFALARQCATKQENWPMLARGIAMSAGFHLDVFDYPGNEALAEEARERAQLANFPASQISGSLDLIFNYVRRGDIARAEALHTETTVAASSIGGWHQWLWEIRLAQARAEIAQGREDWSRALCCADESIARSRARHRIKYEVAGLITRSSALAALDRKPEAIAELHLAIKRSRPSGDPAMLLRAIVPLLALDGDDALHAEAIRLAQQTLAALPTEQMRQRFLEAGPIRSLGPLGSPPCSSPG